MKKYCFISAGEFSGDLLGAELIGELQKIATELAFVGICGEAMQKCGAVSLVPQSAVTVMGVLEVFQRLPALSEAEQKILAWVDRNQPSMAILIDFPGFHLMLAEKLRLRNIPVFQYIAPKLWAWGEGRARRLRENVTLTLGMFPFETEFFRQHQVPFSYIGSPILDRTERIQTKKTDLGYAAQDMVVSLLLGSRKEEIEKLAVVCKEIVDALVRQEPGLHFIIAVAQNLSLSWVQEALSLGAPNVRFLQGMSLETLAVSDVAIVCSGTATLECALLGTPMCVIYRMNALSFKIAKRKVKITWASLVNILADKEVVKEFIQNFEASSVAAEVLELLHHETKRMNMKREFLLVKNSLHSGAAACAAQQILQHVPL